MSRLQKYIRYLPMLAPLPEGYAVFLAMDILNWHPLIRVISGVIVAGTGFWGVQVMNNMAEFNATLKRSEEKEFRRLPTWKAMGVLAVWFGGVTALTVFLDIYPVLQKWTPLGIVVIGFSAAFLFNLSNQYETLRSELMAYRQKAARVREDSAIEKKNERKARQAHRQEIATKQQEIKARLQNRGVVRKEKSGSKLSDATLLLEWSIDPTLTASQMARRLVENGTVESITRQAVEGRLNSMIKKGLVIRTEDGLVREVIFENQDSRPGAT